MTFWSYSFIEYATVGYMAKRIQMRKNRFLAIQKIAEQKKGGGHGSHASHAGHDGHSHSHHSRHGHGHGSISGHSTLSGHGGTISGHNTLSGHGPMSGHGTLPHGMSGHGLSSHGTMSGHGYDGSHRHSHIGHGGSTLSGSLMAADLDHTPRQTVSVANIYTTFVFTPSRMILFEYHTLIECYTILNPQENAELSNFMGFQKSNFKKIKK